MSEHGYLFVLSSVLFLGMRHGIDHDHVAAITDITALQNRAGRAMRMGLVYAAGHAIVLCALGAAAVLIGLKLPDGWDVWRERAVGATLIALGVSVAAGLFAQLRQPHPTAHEFHVRTRAGIMLSGARTVIRWCRRIYGADPLPRHEDHGETPAFLLGVLHGLGAETPSQLLLFVVAAGMSTGAGLASVGAFVVGLFLTNTIVCAAMVGLYSRASVRRSVHIALSGGSATYSVVVGVLYLTGSSRLLPGS